MDDSRPGILYVDDDLATRYAMTRYLQRAGYKVLEAGTGAEALALMKHRPAAVILDLNLPDMDGYEICTRIRNDPDVAATPILMLSATYLDDQARIQGLDTGADGYLTHPVHPSVLIAYLRALIRVRQAEIVSRQIARQWQVTFDTTSNGICVIDAGGVIQRANAAFGAIVNCPAEAIVGQTCNDLAEEAFPFRFVNLSQHAEFEFMTGECWYQLTYDPVIDEDGQSAGGIIVLSDITDRKAFEAEQLRMAMEREQQRILSSFILDVSHEIRTPLAVIFSDLELLELKYRDDDQTLNRLARSKQQVNEIVAMVDAMLTMTRLDAQLRRERTLVEVLRVVEQALDMYEPQMVEKHIYLDKDLQPVPPIAGQPNVLVVALEKLLENAVKFTPPEGTIAVKTYVERGMVVIICADSGPGIAAEDLPHIFERFYRADKARSTRGAGLGLSIAQKIIEELGGHIEVQSQLGAGSEFTIRLPVAITGGAL